MSTPNTMMFVDLEGSTAAFETAGNAVVADIISKVTQWIGRVVEAHGGRVIKFLGDGVLAQFEHAHQAVEVAVFLQQSHTERLKKWPEPLRLAMKIGLASGVVVQVDHDTYGDAVNLSARMSDMAGGHQIWATESVIAELRGARLNASGKGGYAQTFLESTQPGPALDAVRYRSLGVLRIRGLAHPQSVFQIEWSDEVTTDLITVRGALPSVDDVSVGGERVGDIALSWLGSSKVFSVHDLPLTIGRVPDSDFVVSDRRVSRFHARIELIDGALVLTDLSSFGTWVRFAGSPGQDVPLRRSQCILHSTGEIALGAPFSDFSAPVIAFHTRASTSDRKSAPAVRQLLGGLT